MRNFFVASITAAMCFMSGAPKPCAQPAWSVNLVAEYQFRPFGLARHARNQMPPSWTADQGALFLNPDILAVFQVLESHDLPALQPRDSSGGGGKFLFQAVIFDVGAGIKLRTLQLPTTSSGASRIYPTHDGRFLVRTGDALRLYSTEFEQIGFKLLPHSDPVSHETAVISVSRSGRQIFIDYNPGGVREIIDADTLEPLSVPQHPEAAAQSGLRSFHFAAKDTSCPSGGYSTAQYSVGFGCKELKVFSPDGELFWDVPVNEEVVRASVGANTLAALIYHHRANPLDLDLAPEPSRIDLYDLPSKTAKCSIPYRHSEIRGMWPLMMFSQSSNGTIAVLQGNDLSVYPP